jgi:phosphopantothenoylcysteine decarboxylase / phosphopantothenate---cysteine ligase
VEQHDRISGKRLLLGVTGSIAAYKAVDLLRRLQERGAEVHVAMTRHAEQFVSRLTFEALSGRPVLCDETCSGGRCAIGHIDATENADAAIIAPATANVIGKIASGIADDPLTSALMALECPLLIAPAMNDRMYRNPLLQKNIRTLRELGIKFIEPGTGSLACGAIGQGRLADMDRILDELSALFAPQDLAGKTVLVTAGPTREFIDTVRFISNPSTGKMGYALAAAARERGAEVILVTGPAQLAHPRGVRVVSVISAGEMNNAVREHFDQSAIVVMAAAVSDFKPLHVSDRKIKKDEAPATLEFERTVDILRELGKRKDKQILVGFAAETDSLEKNALKKLADKNLDLIVANDLLKTGAGFGTNTNSVVILDRRQNRTELTTMPKSLIAACIMDSIVALLKQRPS